MNNRNLLIDFLNNCQEKRQMPVIDDDNTHIVDDYLRQQNLQQCNVSGSLPLPTEADASAYANGAFGYEDDAYDKERGFMSGYQWTVDWINSKADGNDC